MKGHLTPKESLPTQFESCCYRGTINYFGFVALETVVKLSILEVFAKAVHSGIPLSPFYFGG